MNYKLAKEMYGLQPWLVDQQSLPGLLAILNAVRSGVTLELPETKYNTPFLYTPKAETKLIQWEYELRYNDFSEGIGLINIDGPITVSGGASSIGMRQLSAKMQRMSEDPRIVGFILYADSGGGASSAVKIMVDTINEIKKTKPVEGVIKKGGLAASACYGILSSCGHIYAESEDSIVGSCGTMMQFDGKVANTEYKNDGTKHIRLYASKSTRKNEGFEEALNNDNYNVIINEMLDPTNERFLAMLLENRPALKGTSYDDGHVEFAENAVGTFVDGIQSLQDTAEAMINGLSSSKKPLVETTTESSNIILNSNTMTIQELKQNHPDLYSQVFSKGVEQGAKNEADRVGAWMTYADADLPAVQAGIKSGEGIGQTQREELLIKKSSLNHVEDLENDSPEQITPVESKGDENEETEAAAFYKEVSANLNPVGA